MRHLSLIFFFAFPYFLFCQNKSVSITSKQDSIVFNDTMKKALSFFREKQLDSFKKYTELSSNYSKKTKDLQKVHFYLATYYKYTEKPDSAYYHYHQSKNLAKKNNDSLAIGRRLLSIANIQREFKDYLGSEISSIEALQYLEPIKSYEYLERVYNNLGLVSSELDLEKEALKYYNTALETNKLNNNIIGYLYIINNIGLLYQNKQQHQKALIYFKKGLAFDSIKEKHPTQYALLLENLTYSNYSFGNKERVLQQYNEVLSIRKKLHNYSGISTTHINLSNYFKDFNLTKKALFHSNEALKYAKQTHNNKRWLEALENLSRLTKGEQSKQYLREYITLNDSLFQKERQLKNQFAKIRYETDKKEKENVVLKTENQQKQAEITYQKQQKTIGWLAAVSGLLFSGFSVLFYFQRKRKILYQAQLQKVEAREQERQQIAKSLHDEVAGDLRLLHRKLEKSNLVEEAIKLNAVKENVRNLSHQLSSVSFDKVSFKDQIINLVSDYFELDFKIKVYGIRDYDWTTIDNSIKRLLYLSTRESIQNCKKYAKASTIIIDFSVHKKYVHLNITDNGIGFNTKISKKGIGLQNLQERVEELDGTLTITSEIGKGTQTHIQIPLNV
ncbi:histidine kinase/DNA gyrase B/HSP90-like ATPase [Tenacibaculum lutimaris]|uniref:histidine kinase n=1 Tax=Tenacibaculum lutimaris TaxID=285258 RepID=A0A420E4Y6_9FLAO|nr:tetratricopeptide repeat-containing sensor histidine kinase [Tenacibaculum lutimaris]RKF05176.1 histidine kinase/DNA gyrase B/HSP90-like ATPase [Tenacibaculum lutimaris]